MAIHRRKKFLEDKDTVLSQECRFLERQLDYCQERAKEYQKLANERASYWWRWNDVVYERYRENRKLWHRVHHLKTEIVIREAQRIIGIISPKP